MSVKVLYRADKRSLEQLTKAGGFKSWADTTIEQARSIAKLCMGQTPGGLPQPIVEHLKGNQIKKTLDMSTHIKYTKSGTTSWVSSAINEDCGGQSGGAPIYKITVDVEPYEVRNKELQAQSVYKQMNPALLLDDKNVDKATIIGLMHGPKDDAEVSFFSPIPMQYIKLHKAGKG